MRLVDVDSVIDLFGISDRDIYAKGTIDDALCDGTLEIIEPEQKKGRWIEVYEDERKQMFWHECSECKYEVSWKPNFCPNCGTDMRGENK